MAFLFMMQRQTRISLSHQINYQEQYSVSVLYSHTANTALTLTSKPLFLKKLIDCLRNVNCFMRLYTCKRSWFLFFPSECIQPES